MPLSNEEAKLFEKELSRIYPSYNNMKEFIKTNPNSELIRDAQVLESQFCALDINVIPNLIKRVKELQIELNLSNLANKGYTDGQRNTAKDCINIIKESMPSPYSYEEQELIKKFNFIINKINAKFGIKE
jgi:hypothetical protein